MMRIDFKSEMLGLNLNDKRLNDRCLSILNSFGQSPEKSIPSACSTLAETKAAYNFFKNGKVNAQKILKPHRDSTIQRCRSEATVLYLEDTTEIDCTDNSRLQKLGRLDHLERQGFYCHTSLAITTDGVPLGIPSVSFFDREDTLISHERNYRKTHVKEKESHRWVEGIRNASRLAKDLSGNHIIYIADREADTFHCLFEAKKSDTHCDIIIRAHQDRKTSTAIKTAEKKYKKLYATLEEMPAQGELTFRTQSGRDKKARDVTQTLRFGPVSLKPYRPQFENYHDIEINAILVKEENPPSGCIAVTWVLLTTLPVNTVEDVIKVIKYYTLRWRIEDYFDILKTYCGVEELKLVDASRLQACLAVYMIISWRLLLIQKIAEGHPDEKCTLAFTELEWKIVYMQLHRKQKKELKELPEQVPKMKDFIIMLARIGGFLARKGDGKPGSKSICQGYSVMRALIEGWELCQQYQTYG